MITIGGIDPGKTGGFARLTFDDGKLLTGSVFHVPVLHLKKPGKKTKSEIIDYVALASQWLPEIAQCDEICIELVGAMSKQGVSSTFKFGYSAGFVYGLVAGAKIPHTFSTPQSWKKIVGISGDDKEVSRRRAGQLLPALVNCWPLVKDDGLAEAALIAYSRHSVLLQTGIT